MSRNLIAILLSTYNGDEFLVELLDSLHAQTLENWTLYWRDDGSSDGTQEILSRLPNGMKCVVDGGDSKNIGYIKSFMRLLQAAGDDCRYFAFCDQDDVWLREKLERACEGFVEIR